MGEFRLWCIYLHKLCLFYLKFIYFTGAHRSLVPRLTRVVKPINFDGWIQDHLDIMNAIGNEVANSYWEN